MSEVVGVGPGRSSHGEDGSRGSGQDLPAYWLWIEVHR